jgi:perosamine synthetase
MKFSKRLKLVSCEEGPNYGFGDVLAAKVGLLGFRNVGSKKWVRNWFKMYLSQGRDMTNEDQKILQSKGNLLFTDNGRTSLYLLLKSLNLPKSSEVMIQGYSCVVLPNGVWQAGLNPVLVDVDPQSFNFDIADLKNKITAKTKVIIVQYTFGIIPQMKELIELCNQKKIILIEDCAHSLGGEISIDGKIFPVGSVGQASFFSFGRDKVISTTIGGCLAVNPQPLVNTAKIEITKWLQEIRLNYDILPPMTFNRYIQAINYIFLTVLLIRPLYHLQIGKLVMLLSRKLSLIGQIYTPLEKTGTSSLETNSKYAQGLYPILKNQLQQIDKLNSHRRDLALFYAAELGLDFNRRSVYMRYPVNLCCFDLSPKKSYYKIKNNLRSYGILVGLWYTSPFMQDNKDLNDKFVSQYQLLPNSLKLSDSSVINLPTNRYTDLKDASIIVSEIRKVLGENIKKQ